MAEKNLTAKELREMSTWLQNEFGATDDIVALFDMATRSLTGEEAAEWKRQEDKLAEKLAAAAEKERLRIEKNLEAARERAEAIESLTPEQRRALKL